MTALRVTLVLRDDEIHILKSCSDRACPALRFNPDHLNPVEVVSVVDPRRRVIYHARTGTWVQVTR